MAVKGGAEQWIHDDGDPGEAEEEALFDEAVPLLLLF